MDAPGECVKSWVSFTPLPVATGTVGQYIIVPWSVKGRPQCSVHCPTGRVLHGVTNSMAMFTAWDKANLSAGARCISAPWCRPSRTHNALSREWHRLAV